MYPFFSTHLRISNGCGQTYAYVSRSFSSPPLFTEISFKNDLSPREQREFENNFLYSYIHFLFEFPNNYSASYRRRDLLWLTVLSRHGAGHDEHLDRTEIVSSENFEEPAVAPTGIPRVHRQPVRHVAVAVLVLFAPADQLYVLVAHQFSSRGLVDTCCPEGVSVLTQGGVSG